MALFVLLVLISLLQNYIAAEKGSLPKIAKDGFNTNIIVDEALLEINWTGFQQNRELTIWARSEECDKCNLAEIKTISQPVVLVVDTAFGVRFDFQETIIEINKSICSIAQHFGEYGNYKLIVGTTCDLKIIKDPENSALPILYAFIFYTCLAALWISVKFINGKFKVWDHVKLISYRSFHDCLNLTEDNEEKGKVQLTHVPQERLKSIDAFRGLSLIIMMFVNYGGGSYYFFEHANWNGLTVADLVFPWFTFIMGISIVLSQRSLIRKNISKCNIFIKILKRSIILFLLGLILSNYDVKLEEMRIPGVLQRFGMSYFVTATLELFCPKCFEKWNNAKWIKLLGDVIQYWISWLIMFLLILLHLTLTFLLPVPGCPRGYLGPGGEHDGGQYFNCTGGAAGYIDRVLLGEKHIYSNPTFKTLYDSNLAFDPEGILGTTNSIFLVYLGVQAGRIFTTYSDLKDRINRWIRWAVVLALIGLILCKASKNDGWIPISKNLWSLSFVLIMGGMSFFILSAFYYIMDIREWLSGNPLIYPGMNSILVYCGHEVLGSLFPFKFQVPQTHAAQLALNLWTVSLWVLISAYCYYIKFFITI